MAVTVLCVAVTMSVIVVMAVRGKRVTMPVKLPMAVGVMVAKRTTCRNFFSFFPGRPL